MQLFRGLGRTKGGLGRIYKVIVIYLLCLDETLKKSKISCDEIFKLQPNPLRPLLHLYPMLIFCLLAHWFEEYATTVSIILACWRCTFQVCGHRRRFVATDLKKQLPSFGDGKQTSPKVLYLSCTEVLLVSHLWLQSWEHMLQFYIY